MNGKREQVGNVRVEPPGLFRGRGEHPKMGRIKRRIQPEDIIINIGKDAKVPEAPAGHRWKEVRHDQTVTWMAGWNDSINTTDWKYVQFGATYGFTTPTTDAGFSAGGAVVAAAVCALIASGTSSSLDESNTGIFVFFFFEAFAR